MKIIPLTQGKVTIVDGEDYEWLNQWKWCVRKCGNTWYATRYFKKNGKWTGVQMHREILNLKYKDKKEGDHKNRNGLDNRRQNLRVCTHKENQQNHIKPLQELMHKIQTKQPI